MIQSMDLSNIRLAVTVGAQVSPRAPVLLCGKLEETLKKAKNLGYDAIELQFPNATVLDLDELTGLLKTTGLHVSAVATGGTYVVDKLSLTDDSINIREAAIKRLHGCIDVAKMLSSIVILGCVRGNIPAGGGVDEYLFRLSESLKKVSAYAEKNRVPLVLEAINRYENNFLNSAEETSAFIKSTGLNIKLHLDTFHMNIEERDIFESLLEFKNEIGYIHIADSNRRYPGAGHIDFIKVVETCNKIGYKGYFSAECLPLPDGDTAAERWISYFKNL